MPNSLSALILQISHYGQRKNYAFFITAAFAWSGKSLYQDLL